MAHCLLVPPMLPSGAAGGPTGDGGARRRPGLADVLSSALQAVLGRPNALGLPPRDGVAVLLADGLGAEALAARAGHARGLRGGRRIDTGCPTTTAAAITTLTTGASPGRHGVVGYTALDPAADRVVNQLHGFDGSSTSAGDALPAGWQRSPTLFERAVAESVAAVAVGPRHHAGTGFTREVLRGARYVGARTIADRLDAAVDALAAGPAIAYCYAQELDVIAHREGWESAAWTGQLEALDAAVVDAVRALRPGATLLVVADHGMVDVPEDAHVLVDQVPGLLDGVRHLAGEPRMLHLHLEPGESSAAVADRWGAGLGRQAEVRTRSQAIGAGWFGEVADEVLPRIGDVLVAARGRAAFYDGRDRTGRGMVGQHGAWTTAERFVPLIRFDG